MSVLADLPGPVVLVGAGNMGGALMRGWLSAGMAPADIVVLDPSPAAVISELAEQHSIRCETAPPADLTAGVLFLALKPQVMDTVLPGLKSLVGTETVAVSVAAGKTLASLENSLGPVAAVRAMPNTPAMVGRGITGAFASGAVSDRQRALVNVLLAVSGPVEWLNAESDMDAVTAVSGSGPAYAFYLTECLAEAGRKAGLAPDLAMRLARATVSGAGELMHQSTDDASTLRRNVTSPNGTTAAALAVLMAEDGLQPLMDATVAAAKKRAEELAQ
jgi:pyrroline-5-carboxylate reductase